MEATAEEIKDEELSPEWDHVRREKKPERATTKSTFGGSEIVRSAETAMTASAATSKALVEARYIVALQRPRDLMLVRTKLLEDCRRPRFAELAVYSKPIGGGKSARGPSIRMAEAAMQALGNIESFVHIISDDLDRRIVKIGVADFETNAVHSVEIPIEKTVERSSARGRSVLSSRENSEGKIVYLVEATEEEVAAKQSSIASRFIRNNTFRVLPADILDDAMAEAYATNSSEDAKDPKEAIKRIVDIFMAINVSPSDLKDFLGHDVGKIIPNQLQELRGLFAAIKQEGLTWREVMDKKKGDEGAKPKASGVKDRVKTKAAESAKKAPSADSEPPANWKSES